MKNFQTPVKYGFFTGLILIFYAIILYLTNANLFSPLVSLFSMLINFVLLVVMAVLAVRTTRDKVFEGKITYASAFFAGFLVMLISGYLGALYNYTFATTIDPGYFETQLSNFIENMEGRLPEEALDKMIESVEENMNPSRTLMRSAWTTPVFAVVVSAIIAAVIKKDKTKDITA